MVTVRERTERRVRPMSSGTAGRWKEVTWGNPEESVWVGDLVVLSSLPGTSSGTWTLSHEPQKENLVFDPGGSSPSAVTFIYRELNQLVQYFSFVGTAATYTPAIPSEGPSQPVYHVPAHIIAGRAEPMVYGVGEEERPVVHIEAPILRQYLVSVVGPSKAEYRPGYRLPDDSC